MAEVLKYVNPDAVGLGDGSSEANGYVSLNAWEAAEQTDLVSDGDTHRVVCSSSSGGDDTKGVTLLGWTTGASNGITIEGTDFPTDGVFDATKYQLNITSYTDTIAVEEEYVDIKNLQIQLRQSAGSRYGIHVNSLGTPNLINIESCIIKGNYTTTGAVYGIRSNDSDATVKIYNCIITGFTKESISACYGIGLGYSATTDIYNCVVYDCDYGIDRGTAGTVTATNCAVGSCSNDFDGTMTIDYCCSDDGDGTNSQGPASGSWANEFTSAAGDDFSLVSGGNCIANGTDDPGSGLYSDDIIGTTRVSPWDIGAFEYEDSEDSGIVILRRRMECA